MRIRGMDGDYYDVAQICLNGHVTNSSSQSYPESNEHHCQRCGAKTITACPECGTSIRGFHYVVGIVSVGYERPAFCTKCGTPFPWTSSGLAAARELADTLDGLTPEDREELKKSLEDLVRDTPRTRVAETHVKQIVRRSGREAVDAIRAVITDLVSETIRKTIFGA